MSTLCVLPQFEVCPTLDLRIDYMHAAEPHKDVYGFAQCYRVTPDVIFTRVSPTRTTPSNPSPMWWVHSCAWASMPGNREGRLDDRRGPTMTDTLQEQLRHACEQGDYALLLASIPYAQLIGVECTRQGDDLLFRLPANKDNIGNPLLPAIHGGVIAGFMELAAAVHLLIATGTPGIPKIIDFSWITCAPDSFATPTPNARSGARAGGSPMSRSPPGRTSRPNPSPLPGHISRSRSLQNRIALEIISVAPTFRTSRRQSQRGGHHHPLGV